jgi:hypothetical protein
MNTLRKIITTMLLALPLASPLAAQDLASICKSIGELSIGQWVQFQADAPIVKTLNGRIAIVGEKTVDGSRNFWLEFNIVNPVGNTIMQLLIPSYPYPAEAVSGMIMQLAPDLVMEYPKEMASSMSGQKRDNLSTPTFQACNESETVGVETITVPAGTFETVRVKTRLGGGETDIWISEAVPFGVVKFADTNGEGLKLMAYGMDAKSSVTGTPMKFGQPPNQQN